MLRGLSIKYGAISGARDACCWTVHYNSGAEWRVLVGSHKRSIRSSYSPLSSRRHQPLAPCYTEAELPRARARELLNPNPPEDYTLYRGDQHPASRPAATHFLGIASRPGFSCHTLLGMACVTQEGRGPDFLMGLAIDRVQGHDVTPAGRIIKSPVKDGLEIPVR